MVEYDQLTGEQQDAADATERNVTLTAGAGTGKTTTLTARYLRLLERSIETSGEPLSPEEIITTTFTERAANDLTESVRTEIFDRLSRADADRYEDWRQIADELESGYIHTLHGFCSRLLREHAISATQVDPGFETLDQADTDALIDETVAAVIEQADDSDAVRTLARRFDRGDLQDVLSDLLGERPHSLAWATRMQEFTASEYREYVRTHIHPVGPEAAAELLAAPEFGAAVERLQAARAAPESPDEGGATWGRIAAALDRLSGTPFDDGAPTREKQALVQDLSDIFTKSGGDAYANYSTAKKYWSDEDAKAAADSALRDLVDALEPTTHLVDGSLDADAHGFPLVHALAELTLTAADEYAEQKRRRNVVDFTDQITYAIDFLTAEENAQIRAELREQFEYVMVDEFQDTDPRQWQLIKLLTAEDPADFDARNVFVVGDVKQSIYRFRNADVAQFRETEGILTATNARTAAAAEDPSSTGTDPVDDTDPADQLSTNFRTLPAVLAVINDLFERLFDPEGKAYEARPQRLSPHREDPADLASVEYLLTPTDEPIRTQRFDHFSAFANTEVAADTELEAMALAGRLTQILAEPAQVYRTPDEREDGGDEDDERSPAERALEPRDIAILIRSRSHLKTYERALEDAGIPYTVASGTGFYDSPEITALVNLLRTLADPENERALYATLRSPLFGLTDDTLAQLKANGDPLWEALQSTATDSLAQAADALQTWRARAGVGASDDSDGPDSWAVFLTQIIEETGFLASVSADERPDQARANVEKFRDKLRTMSDDGVCSLTALVTRIERRMELSEREGEAEIAGETAGVRILTIHDAKGMEFPVVVVPGLHRDFNDEAAIGSGRVEFERLGDTHEVGMKVPDPEDPFEMVETVAREAVRDRRRAEERAEERRVLYVACTRARDKLLLSGCHGVDDDVAAPTLTDIEDAAPEDPDSWRDMVQPELLSEDLLAGLTTQERVRAGSVGDADALPAAGEYTVTLPTPPVSWRTQDPPEEPPVHPSPRPPEPEWEYQLSPTDLAPLRAGEAEIIRDAETRVITVHTPDSEDSPTDTSQPAAADRAEDHATASADKPIDPRLFGDLVHRLCELRAPEPKWPDIMEQMLIEREATDIELTETLQEEVAAHARPAIDYLATRTDGAVIEGSYDEVYVTAEFDSGSVSGLIDHLFVTPDGLHIVDYKTSAISRDELETEAAEYEWQMKAYAIALHQQNPERSVSATLYFTGLQEPYQFEWSSAELADVEAELTELLNDALDM